MKTIITLLSLLIFNSSFLISSAQVLCIKCYNQNVRVLTDTNNLVVNGGFENTNCFVSDSCSFCPNSSYYQCNISNWICTGGGINTYAHIVDTNRINPYNNSIIIEGIKAVYFGNSSCDACSATGTDTFCISNIACEVIGIPVGYPISRPNYGDTNGVSLEQTVTGLTAGSIYTLEFWAGGESNFLNEGLFAVDVGFGNAFLRDPVTPPVTGIGTRYVIIFTAVSTSHTIKFTNWGHIFQATELVLDDVRLFKANGEGDPCITGINELNKNGGVSVFPNPFTDKVTVNLTSAFAQIKVFDFTGNLLLTASGDENAINRSLSELAMKLPKGVYMLRLETHDGVDVVNKKFIKM